MRTQSIENAIAELIASGDKRLLDMAAFLAEQLPKGRQRRALRKIVRAI
jgi:hypothetical protein